MPDVTNEEWRPMFYRTSDDAIFWSPWMPLIDVDDDLPHAPFVQTRILVNGEWSLSPVYVWEPL